MKNIRHTEPNFKDYRFFIGEKEYPRESVIEADEEKGYIDYVPENGRKKRETGRVYIVRFEGYDE
jgi:hypothetical protein